MQLYVMNDNRTHWESHHACALERIARLESTLAGAQYQRDRLRAALSRFEAQAKRDEGEVGK